MRYLAASIGHTLSTWQRLPWWGQCIVFWLVEVIVLSSIGLVSARYALSIDKLQFSSPVSTSSTISIPDIWIHWDAGWYQSIASIGYVPGSESMAFFPLYPLTFKSLSVLTGWRGEISAIVISHMFFLIAILFMYKLARLVHDEHEFALRSVLYMMLFPTAFFFLAGYAESMLITLLIMGAYFYLRKPRQNLAGSIALSLAGAARPLGWTAGIIYGIEFLQARDFRLRSIVWFVVNCVLIIVGLFFYFYHLFTITGSWTAYIDAHASWEVTWQWPWLSIIKSIELIFSESFRDNWFLFVLNIFDLIFGIYCLVLTFIAIRWSLLRKFPWSLTAFLVANLLIIFSRFGFQVPLDDMARWALILFPLYFVMSHLTETKPILRRSILILSGLSLCVLTAWWCTGRWVG